MEEVTQACSSVATNASTVTHQLCHVNMLENVVNDARLSIGWHFTFATLFFT